MRQGRSQAEFADAGAGEAGRPGSWAARRVVTQRPSAGAGGSRAAQRRSRCLGGNSTPAHS